MSHALRLLSARAALTLVILLAPVVAASAQPLSEKDASARNVGVESPDDSAGYSLWPDDAPAATFRVDADAADEAKLRRLIREELRSEKERDSERGGDESREESAAAKQQPEAQRDGKPKPPTLDDVWEHGFVAESSDKQFRVHFGGRFDWDNAWFQQDKNLLLGPNPPVDLEDGSAMRRARLRADGTVYGWIDFVTEVNFATIQDVSNVDNDTVPIGSVGLTDFHLTFRDLPLVGNLRAGHFVAPLSLERYTSANFLYYMERSPVFDAFFGPNTRQSGLMLFDSWFDDRMTVASSFTRVGKSTLNSFAFDAEDGLYAAGTRVTVLPVYLNEGRVLMHVGANYFRQALSDNRFAVANRLPLRAGGGSQQVPNIVATGTFFAPDEPSIFDAELAVVCGPLSFSSEYACAWGPSVFEQYDGHTFSGPRGSVTYHAGYVESGLFVTRGDYRRYDRKTGTWSRTIPEESIRMTRAGDCSRRSGHGAVQLLARYSYLDLVSGNPTLTPASGGARAGLQKDLTLGANWYLNPQTIISVNYVSTRIDSVVAGASGNIQGIGTRVHFDF